MLFFSVGTVAVLPFWGLLGMDIFKDSKGDWKCRVCGGSFRSYSEAVGCLQSHAVVQSSSLVVPRQDSAIVAAQSSFSKYEEEALSSGTLEAAKRLCLSMIFDYELSRQRDLADKGRPSAMTMTLAKNASESLRDYNKLCFGERSSSMNVNVDVKRKSDLDAIREILSPGLSSAAPSSSDVVVVSSVDKGD